MKWMLMLGCLALLTACKTDMYTHLDQREANRMSAVLMQKGIPVDREIQKDGTVNLVVSKDRFAEAVSILNDAGLPGESFATMGDIFQSNGLVSSPVQERAQMIYALSEELSHTVSQVDGVLTARVHVVLPDNDLLKRNVTPSSASVFIRYQPGRDISQLIPKIKTLVANSISGLSYERVSIVPVEAEVATQSTESSLVSFMGFWMLPESKARMQRLVITVLLALVLGGALGGYVYWRKRQPETFVLERTSSH